MIEELHNTYHKTMIDEETKVIYNLFFKNALYSLECFRKGDSGRSNYCYLENFTDDEGEAETFLKKIFNGQVLPIQIKEIAEDYFGI